MQDVYVILYKNFTALDAFGPIEALARIEDFQIRYVSLEGGIVTNHQSIRIETEPMSVIEDNGIILVPGGWGSRDEVNNTAFLNALGDAATRSEFVLCVCTGSALVAKTGVLDGKRATTNKRAFDWVKSQRDEVQWERQARWVHDGKFYTSAGVSAGIDMALGFIRDQYGLDKAVEIYSGMEYHWNDDADHDSF
ncbi:MAG: DJ-1/PfpI family protein [Veillonella sp.]|uniref:DJ-1/PfpI family protein n=1 Tax=Veillonella sp. TaxID=1926307 RepID=UPI0025DCCC08|nr:DJ-1/PfpI family protein [Veillonella sp.]MBS4912913.1 DJ-1/PfpI family protein [Veillonella sp.]